MNRMLKLNSSTALVIMNPNPILTDMIRMKVLHFKVIDGIGVGELGLADDCDVWRAVLI